MSNRHELQLDPTAIVVAAEAEVGAGLHDVEFRARLSRISVAGFARAGTTFLQSMLATDPANCAPKWWEVMHPSPPPGLAATDDHRHQLAQREVAAFLRQCPGVRRAHPYFVEGDETLMECESILTFDLRNTYPLALHQVPVFVRGRRRARRIRDASSSAPRSRGYSSSMEYQTLIRPRRRR